MAALQIWNTETWCQNVKEALMALVEWTITGKETLSLAKEVCIAIFQICLPKPSFRK